jgi:hypothetical protein
MASEKGAGAKPEVSKRLELPNFRIWPTRDLVTMSKAALKHRKVRYAGLPQLPEPSPSPIPAKRAELNPKLIELIARLLPAQASKLSLHGALAELGTRSTPNVYPYAKGPDFSNEGIGYGDVVNVDMICSENGRPSIAAHSARRTRSGLTALTKKDELLALSKFTTTHTSQPPAPAPGTPMVRAPRGGRLPNVDLVPAEAAAPAKVVLSAAEKSAKASTAKRDKAKKSPAKQTNAKKKKAAPKRPTKVNTKKVTAKRRHKKAVKSSVRKAAAR